MARPRLTQRERIYNYIARRRTGATRAEIVRALAIPHPATCRRVDELLTEGYVAKTGYRANAEVLKSTLHGQLQTMLDRAE